MRTIHFLESYAMKKIKLEPTLSFQSNDAYNKPVGVPRKMTKIVLEPALSFQSNDAYNKPVGAARK
jgi:hypothetical protein